jgi:hypothetical protein
MRSINPIFAALAVAGLSACAPTVWSRPGTSQAEFNMDRARCQLMAEGANPGRDIDPVHTGHLKRDLAANAALGVLSGIAQGAAVSHTFSLCMQAKGYMPGEMASAAPTPATIPAAAAQSMPPVQSASIAPVPLGSPPVRPVAAVTAAPMPAAPACTNGELKEDLIGRPVPVCNAYRASYTR